MVKLNHALKSDKSIFMGLNRAKDLFFEVAATDTSDPEAEPQIGFDDFVRLIALILTESNAEAKKQGRPAVPIPTLGDLKAVFNRADVDNSKSVDEFEFLGLYQQVMNGQVKGLGKSGISFYIRPHQLIHFGQVDVAPESTDWQDLFFDLLFVAGAFQTGGYLSTVLKANDTDVLEGIVWAFAISLTLAQQWFMKMLLAARFGYSSLFHYCVDNIEFILLAFAMWHIPPDNMLLSSSDSSSYSSYSSYGSGSRKLMAGISGDYYSPLDQIKQNIHGRAFGFSLCISLNCFLYICKWSEIAMDPAATSGAVVIARHQVGGYITCCLIYLTGAIFAVIDDLQQYVVYCWMCGIAAYILNFYLWVMFLHEKKRQGKLTSSGVPMNVPYVTQRVGEYCMLMIGETVLSLFYVITPENKNYLMFGMGMFVACNFHFQHFSSYPGDASKHVLHKGTFDYRSLSYICVMIYLYPFILILVGVCMKNYMKAADLGEVYGANNWAFAIGLVAQYLTVNFFFFIHDKSRGKELNWKPFQSKETALAFAKKGGCKLLSMAACLEIAALELRPYPTLMWSGLVVFIQSCIILFFAPRDENDLDHQEIIAMKDFEYQQEKARERESSLDRVQSSMTTTSVNSNNQQQGFANGSMDISSGANVDIESQSFDGNASVSSQGNGSTYKSKTPSREERKKKAIAQVVANLPENQPRSKSPNGRSTSSPRSNSPAKTYSNSSTSAPKPKKKVVTVSSSSSSSSRRSAGGGAPPVSKEDTKDEEDSRSLSSNSSPIGTTIP